MPTCPSEHTPSHIDEQPKPNSATDATTTKPAPRSMPHEPSLPLPALERQSALARDSSLARPSAAADEGREHLACVADMSPEQTQAVEHRRTRQVGSFFQGQRADWVQGSAAAGVEFCHGFAHVTERLLHAAPRHPPRRRR